MSKLDEIRALRERKYIERHQQSKAAQPKRVPKTEVKAKARAKR